MSKGINQYRTNNGLGKISTDDRKFTGMVMGGVAASGGVQLNTVYELNNLNDAAALKITPAYDTTNTTLVYYHIKEFFRLSPSGKLYIMLVSQSTTLTDICDVTTTYGVLALANDAKCKGKLRYIGVALNPASGYTPTITNGINSDVIAVASDVYSGAVVKAQALAVRVFGQYKPGRIFIEARDFTGVVGDLIDATASASNQVQLVIAADNDVSAANALYNGHAAVGTALGLRSNLQIHQQISYVALGNLQDPATGNWVNPGLSSNTLLSAFSQGYWENNTYTDGDMDTIQAKGFIGPETYTDYAGVFFACDITACATTDDYNLGPNGLVVNEAARVVYLYMVPNLGIDLNVTSTGLLDPLLVATWQGEITKALTDNLSGNVSAIKAVIDPNQNVVSTDTVTVQIVITPKGYANTITIPIGLTNPFGN